MQFTFEDALQIHHAKCEKIEVYKLANPAEAWAGFGVTAICPTDDFYSDDELVAFDSFAGQGFSRACDCKGRT